ncbi:MAG: S41 family peptidase [Bacteroidota bacterium]|nr:S41 family peptidase [Bacteroidota bacterium]
MSFNRFDPEEEAIHAFDRIAHELTKAKGVIIDLRNNGGGSTTVGWQLQKYLTKGKYFLNYAWETRINDGAGKANGNWLDEDKDYFLNKACRFEEPDIEVKPTIEDYLKGKDIVLEHAIKELNK